MTTILTTSDSIAETAQKIEGFQQLQPGWHYGSGVAPTDATIALALKLNEAARAIGFRKTNAFPGIEGEIMVTFYHDSTYLEFTVAFDGRLTFIHEEDDHEKAYEDHLSFQEAMSRIRAFQGKIWASSGLFTGNTMTAQKGFSKASLLNPPLMEAESQSLMKNASIRTVRVSAPILSGFMGTTQGVQLSIGTSSPKSSQRSAGSSSKQASQAIFATTTSSD